jgi:hypothetical protein
MVQEGSQRGETRRPDNESVIEEYEPTFSFEMKVVEG